VTTRPRDSMHSCTNVSSLATRMYADDVCVCLCARVRFRSFMFVTPVINCKCGSCLIGSCRLYYDCLGLFL